MTQEFFRRVRIKPERGRAFLEGEFTTAEPRLVLLSEKFWREQFGADPEVVGTPVKLNGHIVAIIGIMPAGFEIPQGVSIWLPGATPNK